eukprot:TRINITY_DN1128_c1_g1_i1.p1 TRINITY_DN1128_c1_g1~~TRINITY_DN1128_c1_g1_i1.p1  ORF type:complete len:733 (-),score=148.10 TRINITY_DN1128_c1_g1_i1:54-2252(-)
MQEEEGDYQQAGSLARDPPPPARSGPITGAASADGGGGGADVDLSTDSSSVSPFESPQSHASPSPSSTAQAARTAVPQQEQLAKHNNSAAQLTSSSSSPSATSSPTPVAVSARPHSDPATSGHFGDDEWFGDDDAAHFSAGNNTHNTNNSNNSNNTTTYNTLTPQQPAGKAVRASPSVTLSRSESWGLVKQQDSEFADFALKYVSPAVLLCGAAASGNLARLREIAAVPGVDINAADYDGRTALHLAAEEGKEDCVRFLIERGAEINALDKRQSTPLRGAIVNHHENIARLLRQYDAHLSVEERMLCDRTVQSAIHGEEQIEELKAVFRKFVVEKQIEKETEEEDIVASTAKIEQYLVHKYGLKPKRIHLLQHQLQHLDEDGTIHWRRFIKYIRTAKHPVLQNALAGKLAIPKWEQFTQEVTKIFNAVRAECRGQGTPSRWLPEADAKDMGLCIVTVDGQRFTIGDYEKGFPISACAMPMLYSFCLEDLGAEALSEYVGREPSGQGSNSFELNEHKRPHNPLNPAGGIVLASLFHPRNPMSKRFKEMKSSFKSLAGHQPIGFSQAAYLTQKDFGYQYSALANFMKAEESLPEGANIPNTVDLYLQGNALEMDCTRLATAASTFANNGVCPITNDRVLHPDTVKSVLQVMYSCGMYDYSGEWACTIGIPAKSGTSGCIFLVIPSLLGLCVWAPPLDANGNSFAGTEFCRRFANHFKWSIFDVLYNTTHHTEHY